MYSKILLFSTLAVNAVVAFQGTISFSRRPSIALFQQQQPPQQSYGDYNQAGRPVAADVGPYGPTDGPDNGLFENYKASRSGSVSSEHEHARPLEVASQAEASQRYDPSYSGSSYSTSTSGGYSDQGYDNSAAGGGYSDGGGYVDNTYQQMDQSQGYSSTPSYQQDMTGGSTYPEEQVGTVRDDPFGTAGSSTTVRDDPFGTAESSSSTTRQDPFGTGDSSPSFENPFTSSSSSSAGDSSSSNVNGGYSQDAGYTQDAGYDNSNMGSSQNAGYDNSNMGSSQTQNAAYDPGYDNMQQQQDYDYQTSSPVTFESPFKFDDPSKYDAPSYDSSSQAAQQYDAPSYDSSSQAAQQYDAPSYDSSSQAAQQYDDSYDNASPDQYSEPYGSNTASSSSSSSPTQYESPPQYNDPYGSNTASSSSPPQYESGSYGSNTASSSSDQYDDSFGSTTASASQYDAPYGNTARASPAQYDAPYEQYDSNYQTSGHDDNTVASSYTTDSATIESTPYGTSYTRQVNTPVETGSNDGRSGFEISNAKQAEEKGAPQDDYFSRPSLQAQPFQRDESSKPSKSTVSAANEWSPIQSVTEIAQTPKTTANAKPEEGHAFEDVSNTYLEKVSKKKGIKDRLKNLVKNEKKVMTNVASDMAGVAADITQVGADKFSKSALNAKSASAKPKVGKAFTDVSTEHLENVSKRKSIRSRIKKFIKGKK